MKSKNSEQTLSRSQMLQWINKTLSINQTRIQNLGSGVVYCLLLNNFYPNCISSSKILMMPRSHHDYKTNLRRFQQAVNALQLRSISFDIFKLSELTYHDNWNLICKLYKHLLSLEKEKPNHSEQYTKEPLKEQSTKEPLKEQYTRESQKEQYTKESQKEQYTKEPLREQIWWNPTLRPTEISKIHKNHQTTGYHFGHPILNPINTPLKGFKSFDQNGKIRNQTLNLIDQIKKIVVSEQQNDRGKVNCLKKMLGLGEEEGQEEEIQLKDLLSDYKKKEEVIQID